MLNKREEFIFSRSAELNRREKDLEGEKLNLENDVKSLNEGKRNLEVKLKSLSAREEVSLFSFLFHNIVLIMYAFFILVKDIEEFI